MISYWQWFHFLLNIIGKWKEGNTKMEMKMKNQVKENRNLFDWKLKRHIFSVGKIKFIIELFKHLENSRIKSKMYVYT